MAVAEHLRCSVYPRVGAIVAKDGQLLSSGYRGEREKIHAERVALEKLTSSDCVGATIYTTLEPCVQIHDAQEVESCTDLIISRGITTVVVGVLDPNATVHTRLSKAAGEQYWRELLHAETTSGR